MEICLTEVQSANNNQFDYQDSSNRFVYLNRMNERTSMLQSSQNGALFEIVRCPFHFIRSHLFIKPRNKYFGAWFICQTSINYYLRRIHLINRIIFNIQSTGASYRCPILWISIVTVLTFNILAFERVDFTFKCVQHLMVSLLFLNMVLCSRVSFVCYFILDLMSAINKKESTTSMDFSLFNIYSMSFKYNGIHWTKRICWCH